MQSRRTTRRSRARGGPDPPDPSALLGTAASLLAAAAAAALATRLLTPREPPPEVAVVPLERFFTAEEVRRARRFAAPMPAIALAGALADAAALLVLARRPPRPWRDPRRPDLAGAVAGAGLSTALLAIGLPFAALARHRARSVGLVTQGWRGWAVDQGRMAGVGAALAAPAGAVVVALMRRSPERWWLPAAAGATGAGAVLTFLAPVVLHPLFNRFTPLPPGPRRDEVLALARGAGVEVGEVYEVDASRRVTAANAYVTGLGATKRVVLFDTLLRDYPPPEIRVVVAHELAHVRHRDVLRGLLHGALVAGPAARATALLARILGSPREPGPASLAPLALAAGTVGAIAGPFGARLSRRVEARADADALRLTASPAAYVALWKRIVVTNLADPDPPAWRTALLASHPPVRERIGIALAYARREGLPVAGESGES